MVLLHIVPARDVARILNNESNLKILDKLKVRPYYPRELAQEMELSEPFVVRRLKAMEEEGIVEGRWETEGSRKVKRYYLMDVSIEYGKEGLKFSSEDIPVKPGIDMKKEVVGRLIKLPLIISIPGGHPPQHTGDHRCHVRVHRLVHGDDRWLLHAVPL